MQDTTKIMLSPQELEIVKDTSWVLTKQQIIKKIYDLFHSQVPVLSKLFERAKETLPAPLLSTVPKISRGENYRNLPYVILDYPALFDKENIFALRTMFWWGNFFSITLHLSGRYKELYQANIIELLANSGKTDLNICLNDKAWEHHFEPSNYVPANSFSSEELTMQIHTRSFLKVAVKISLNQWNELETLLPEEYKKLVQLVS